MIGTSLGPYKIIEQLGVGGPQTILTGSKCPMEGLEPPRAEAH